MNCASSGTGNQLSTYSGIIFPSQLVMPRSRSTTRLDGRRRSKGADLDVSPTKLGHGSISTFSTTLESATATSTSLSEVSHRRRRQRSTGTLATGTLEPFFGESTGDGHSYQNESNSERSSRADSSRPSVSSRGPNTSRRSDRTSNSSHRSSTHRHGTKSSRSSRQRQSKSVSHCLLPAVEQMQSNQMLTLDSNDDDSFSDLSSFDQGTDQNFPVQLNVRHLPSHSRRGSYSGAELTEDESISSSLSEVNRDDRADTECIAIQRIPSICRQIPGRNASTGTKSLRRPSLSDDCSQDWAPSEDSLSTHRGAASVDSWAPQPARRKSFTSLFTGRDAFQRIDDDVGSPLRIRDECHAEQSLTKKVLSHDEMKRRRRSFQGLTGGATSYEPDKRASRQKTSSRDQDCSKNDQKSKLQRRPSFGELFIAFTGDSKRGRRAEQREQEPSRNRSHSLGTLIRKRGDNPERTKAEKQRRPSTKSGYNVNDCSEKGFLDHSDCESLTGAEKSRAMNKLGSSSRHSSRNLSKSAFVEENRDDEKRVGNDKLRNFRESLVNDRRSDTRGCREYRKSKASSSSRGDSKEGSRKHQSRSSESRRHTSRHSSDHTSSSRRNEHGRSKSRSRLSECDVKHSSNGHSSRNKSRSHKRSHSRPRDLMESEYQRNNRLDHGSAASR